MQRIQYSALRSGVIPSNLDIKHMMQVAVALNIYGQYSKDDHEMQQTLAGLRYGISMVDFGERKDQPETAASRLGNERKLNSDFSVQVSGPSCV